MGISLDEFFCDGPNDGLVYSSVSSKGIGEAGFNFDGSLAGILTRFVGPLLRVLNKEITFSIISLVRQENA